MYACFVNDYSCSMNTGCKITTKRIQADYDTQLLCFAELCLAMLPNSFPEILKICFKYSENSAALCKLL